MKLNSKIIITLFVSLVFASCATSRASKMTKNYGANVEIPFIKNSPDECYYLDEFMPMPDSLVPGKTGTLNLRYYTYKMANYKDWQGKKIVLSFYSSDNLCWSLFEEYHVVH